MVVPHDENNSKTNAIPDTRLRLLRSLRLLHCTLGARAVPWFPTLDPARPPRGGGGRTDCSGLFLLRLAMRGEKSQQ